MLLKDKTILITGASRGIGRGIALVCAQHGASVAFTYLNSEEKARQLELELADLGCKATGYKSDASDTQAAQVLIDQVMADFSQIDVLINNAGITRDNLLLRMTEEMWDEVMNTNLKSTFVLTKAIIKPMMKARKGSIINISSVVGINGNAGQSNYAASKSGMIGFTKSVARELGSRNIRANAIAPGYIKTEMTGHLDPETESKWLEGVPLQRPGTVQDVANLCVFLSSDLSAYITGQTIGVCGGMTMH